MGAALGLLATLSGHAYAQPDGEEGESTGSSTATERGTWRARVGIGLNPRLPSDELPRVNTGFGASLAGFFRLYEQLSAGAAFDWERYTFDSRNHGDPANGAPRYTDQALSYTRLMGLVQLDLLPRQLLTPYLTLGAGYGWERAELTDWQCRPKNGSGAVFGAGAGLDVAIHDTFSAGLEYRANSVPVGARGCTQADIPEEPMRAPLLVSQRVSLTLSAIY